MRALIFGLLAGISLAALWYFLAPQAVSSSASPASEPVKAMTQVSPGGAEAADFSWQIRTGKISGPEQIELPAGESVSFSVSSDDADEIHLHGYEQVLMVPANGESILTLTLEHSGRFELESHRLHRVLSVLIVEPR